MIPFHKFQPGLAKDDTVCTLRELNNDEAHGDTHTFNNNSYSVQNSFHKQGHVRSICEHLCARPQLHILQAKTREPLIIKDAAESDLCSNDAEVLHSLSIRMALEQVKPSFSVAHPETQELQFPTPDGSMKKAKFGAQLEEEELQRYKSLFSRFHGTFITGHVDMPGTNLAEFTIDIPPDTKPKMQKLRRLAPKHVQEVKEEVFRLLGAGCIEPIVYPEWFSPIVISMKKNGKIRMCVDFRELNRATRKR